MYGDFTLNPLAYRDRVSRVLWQQGRVQLDSDANEATESLLRFLRGLAFDAIGAHGGIGNSFELVTGGTSADLVVRWGVYYVDGIRCLNYPPDFDILQVATGAAVAEGVTYKAQPYVVFAGQEDDWTKDAGPATTGPADRLLYLDVFERHVSAMEDDSLREVALLGPDTASRAVIVWQVRAMPFKPFDDARALVQALPPTWGDTWDVPYLALNLALRSRGRMRARAVVTDATEPCTVAPDARYRGTENRLFRVEVHDTGAKPTFKWSPDNAAVVYPIRGKIEGTTVRLDSLGRDDRTAIQVNDWVEVVDDRVQLMGRAHPLLQVVEVRPFDTTVILNAEPADNAGGDEDRHPILRRWASDAVPFQESTGPLDHWYELADGVEVQFAPLVAGAGSTYRTGDHWLIPTRTATGDVQWPDDGGTPRALPPHGVQHHYAPLARITAGVIAETYRRSFTPMSKA